MKFAKPLAALLLLLSLFSGSPAFAQSEANCSVLYAGQTTQVGSVCVTVNADDVFLDYLLIGDWKLSEAHAWIGDSLANLPVNSAGNPQIGLFPHNATNLGSATQHSFVIPITDLTVNADTFCNAEVFVAAHAVVTRTIPGVPVSGGGSGGGSGGSGDGKSDKSDKSGQSGKSGKSGQSGKSDKSGQSDKSGYSSKSSDNNSKGSASSAKNNGKGKTYNAVSATTASNAKAAPSSKSNNKPATNTSSKNKSDQSGKSGHSGKSGQSGKSDKSGGGSSGGGTTQPSTQPSTQTESAWAGTMQINNGGSWARYFSFNNDFCVEEPEEPPVVVLPQGCFNVFAVGQTAFSPVGVPDSVTGWIHTFTAADTGFGTILSDGVTDYGTIIGYLPGNGTLELYYSLNNVALVFHSANAYAGAPGSFTNVSPLQYGNSATGTGSPFLVLNLAAQESPQLEVVAHAAVCPAGVIN